MKIDIEKIVGFNEMTPEEKVEALTNYEFDAPKVEDNSAEVLKLKNALNKASSDVADFKRQLRERQTEAERIEAERVERETERDNLLKTLMREKDISNYKANLMGAGFSSELAESSAIAMADNDFNTIFANLNAFNQAKEKEIKASVLKGTPSPIGGSTEKTITKEQFNSMSYAELVKLNEENPELYQELNQ